MPKLKYKHLKQIYLWVNTLTKKICILSKDNFSIQRLKCWFPWCPKCTWQRSTPTCVRFFTCIHLPFIENRCLEYKADKRKDVGLTETVGILSVRKLKKKKYRNTSFRTLYVVVLHAFGLTLRRLSDSTVIISLRRKVRHINFK